MPERLSSAIQESLVCLLAYDPQASKLVRALVPANLYDPFFVDFVKETEQYIDRYGKPPGEHLFDITNALKERKPDSAENFDRIFRSLHQTKDGINRDYVLAQAGKFVRKQRARAAAVKALQLLQRDGDTTLDEAEALMQSIGKNGHEQSLFDPGGFLHDPAEALAFLDAEEEEVFPTGVPLIDDMKLGPIRKGLWLFIAGPKRGKTWMGVSIGKACNLAGKRVLHVSLEMSRRKVLQRYVQAFFSVSKREAEVVVQRFKSDELGRFESIEERKITNRPHFQQEDIRRKLSDLLGKQRTRPRLVVKDFPSGTLTIKQFKGYLDNLEATCSFLPDCTVFDYPDLMEHDPKFKRQELGKLMVDLRGIASERNMAVAAFSQANREGESVKRIGFKQTGEDITKVHTADTVWTYNQTDAEQERGLARLFNAGAREEAKFAEILISQAYAIGQFCLDSAIMQREAYWPAVEGKEEDE